MNINDVIKLYEDYKERYGSEATRYISKLLAEIQEAHKADWLKMPTKQKDHEQSWRSFKGKNYEKLVFYIIKDEVERMGLKVIEGKALEKNTNQSEELSGVKKNLLVDYGDFGAYLPDVDIVIYDPISYEVFAIISSKITLRERIAQTGYWKIKLSQDEATKHIKVFFITPDEDNTLKSKWPAKKGRAIVEVDTDGTYVMSEEDLEESNKVKNFNKFFMDMSNLIYAKRNQR